MNWYWDHGCLKSLLVTWIKHILSKSVNDMKLCGVANMLEGRDIIQRDPDKLERWACVNLTKFNTAKCKVLHLCPGSTSTGWLENGWRKSPEEDRGLQVLVYKQHTTWQCALSAQKLNHALGCIKSSVRSRSREVILPLYSTLKKSHLQFCVKLWGLQHKKEVDLLEQIQRRPQGQSRGLSTSPTKAERTGVFQPGEEKAPNALMKPFST